MPKYILINSQKDAARIYNYRKLLFLKKIREIKGMILNQYSMISQQRGKIWDSKSISSNLKQYI
ncbi:putative integrase [Orientia tsutsugamushi str. Gilliam]|uniref:Putative integrase n=1 Tax=Orientia tsutsugamushi str. Gilliam TaxID=1359184 RepID=A0A0F3M8T7_ORITS|nr:putative integrase [Orientia tsutsugamushi str. Gilliam]